MSLGITVKTGDVGRSYSIHASDHASLHESEAVNTNSGTVVSLTVVVVVIVVGVAMAVG